MEHSAARRAQYRWAFWFIVGMACVTAVALVTHDGGPTSLAAIAMTAGLMVGRAERKITDGR